jgi:hypothetical protein
MRNNAHQSPTPDFGNFHDNETAYILALYDIAHGAEQVGQQTLVALRQHIMATGEAKSVVHLLPLIEAKLATLLVSSGI